MVEKNRNNSKVIIDVDKNNLLFCWENKDHILQRVAFDNKRVPLRDWKKFYETMEKNFGDDTPAMLDKFRYKDDVMRCWITYEGEGDYQLTLKDLPTEIFGKTYKTFKQPTIFECYKSGYDYVTSRKAEYEEADVTFWKKKLEILQDKYNHLEEEKKDLLRILDDISEEESEKAATERENLPKNKSDELEYHYDYATESFRQVDHFDEFRQPVLKKRGFEFNAEIGMRIIFLYHCKGFTPKQIVNHMSLHNLNKAPHLTVGNFIKVYNKGLLERTILFCCNNPYHDIKYNPNELLKYPNMSLNDNEVAIK